MTMSKYDLVKIVGDEKAVEFAKRDEFLEFLNQDPPEAWLEGHPMAKGVKYLPIGMVELLLTKIFQQWRVEVLREGQLMNSITCTVRLHYKDPLEGTWTFQDGVAAVPAKTTKGSKASDMSEILSDAIMTGLPAAKSFAIKDAADEIGKIFGRDINRKGNLAFNASYKKSDEDKALQSIKEATTTEELDSILSNMDATSQKAFASAVRNRAKEINNA
jgi:hypothetical protein